MDLAALCMYACPLLFCCCPLSCVPICVCACRAMADRWQRSVVDLRAHRIFMSNPRLECCPTVTQFNRRSVGISPQGVVVELFNTVNFTQAFYETICNPGLKDNPCQFIDAMYKEYSRCVQQYSYVYSLVRTLGHHDEPFRFDYVRISTGCKCQLAEEKIKL